MNTIKLVMNLLNGVVYVCILGFLAIAAPLVMGYHPVVVLSGSMEPTYGVGSVIYYKEASFEEIAVGDPITFQNSEDGIMVTHRVVEKDEAARAFGTEGDANGGRDPGMVSYENVIGKATPFCIPYAGYFVNAGKQPMIIFVMVLILLMGIVTDQVVKKQGSEKRGKGEGASQKE